MTKLIISFDVKQETGLMDINFDIEGNETNSKDEMIAAQFTKEQVSKILIAAMKKGMKDGN